ncbi:MAG: TlpA disulfide reductase family protein [Flavobacteriales bacterium]|nr:TlpA disulfide reductase family protein [Flavobacteriales bacterium]
MTNKMKYMSFFGIIMAAGLGLSACNGGDTKSNGKNSTVSAADTAKVRILAFTNGVNEQNKGASSGTIEVKGTLQGSNFPKLYLYETEGKTTIKIDSTTVTGGSFSFGSNKYDAGVYMLGPNEQNLAAVILNPKESVVELTFRGGKLDGSMAAVNSKENEGWIKYQPMELSLNKQIKDNYVAGGKNKAMKAKYDAAAQAKEEELAKFQGEIITQYPETFLAKMLTWKQEPNRSEVGKYWENCDFSDEGIIHTMVLPDRIQNFMRWFSGGKDDGFYNCIDMVVAKAKANERVLEFSLYNMLEGFYTSNMENISMYITDNYIFGDACGDVELSNVLKSRAEGIVNLRIGNVPPNINLRTLDGGTFDLYSTATKNKYTLVFFWSSWCEHCQAEAPEYEALYKNFKSKGFDMVGVSVDNQRTAWEQAVTQRGFTFPQVCGFKQWESPVAKDYKVTKTPTLFLLDKDKKIVFKPKSAKEVQNWLAANLK